MAVSGLPPEVLLEICCLACTDGRTGSALRCVSKSMSELVKPFYMASVTVTGYNGLSGVIAAHKAFTTGKFTPTRNLLLCDCASYNANRDQLDEAWDMRRSVQAEKRDAYEDEVEETIAEINPHDRAKFNDWVLRDMFDHFGPTLHTLKIMLFLPHKPFILLHFLRQMDLPGLEELAIAGPEDLYKFMSEPTVTIANSHRTRLSTLRQLRLNVLGTHPGLNLVNYCRLIFTQTPFLRRIIIEAYPIMGIVHGAKGTAKWVKNFVNMCATVFADTHKEAVPTVEIVPLIGEDMHAAQAVAMKKKLIDGETEMRHGAIITSFCETIPLYDKWRFE
jgi:hypothetical protein